MPRRGDCVWILSRRVRLCDTTSGLTVTVVTVGEAQRFARDTTLVLPWKMPRLNAARFAVRALQQKAPGSVPRPPDGCSTPRRSAEASPTSVACRCAPESASRKRPARIRAGPSPTTPAARAKGRRPSPRRGCSTDSSMLPTTAARQRRSMLRTGLHGYHRRMSRSASVTVRAFRAVCEPARPVGGRVGPLRPRLHARRRTRVLQDVPMRRVAEVCDQAESTCDYGDIAGGGVYVLEKPGRSLATRDLVAARLPRRRSVTSVTVL